MKKALSYSGLIFFSCNLLANDSYSFLRKKDTLLISAKNCNQLYAEVRNLAAWRLARNEAPIGDIKLKRSRAGCSAELKNVAPIFTEKFHGANAKGPNCWNTTLVLNEIIPAKRFSSGEEMTFWMESPLCQKVLETDLKAGDIGAIRLVRPDGSLKESHGFIHVSPNLVFHKPGPGASEAYQFDNRQEMLKGFTTLDKAFNIQIDYYRCQKLSDYLKNKNAAQLSAYRRLDKAVTDVECDAESRIFIHQPNNAWLKTNILILEKLIENEVQYALKENSDEIFLWHSLMVRLNSLKTQALIDSR